MCQGLTTHATLPEIIGLTVSGKRQDRGGGHQENIKIARRGQDVSSTMIGTMNEAMPVASTPIRYWRNRDL